MLIVDDIEQGTAAWVALRLGIPTASQFHRIVTPTGKLSTQRDQYMAQLLAEWALGEPVEEFAGSIWTDFGKAIEPDAFAYYQFVTDNDARTVALVYKDETKSVACSPDFLAAGDTIVGELKSGKASSHIMRLWGNGVPSKHVAQVQGQLWVTGLERADYMSYYPGLPELLVHVDPDETLQKAFSTHIPLFVEEMLEGRERLRQMGVVVDE